MPKKWNEENAFEEMLTLYTLLLFNGRKYTLTELVNERTKRLLRSIDMK